MMLITLGFLIVAGQTAQALVLPGGVGRLPALGWNSWNAYACNINESSFLVAAEAMVSLGFKASRML
jgi:alpha-galactosidase